MTVRGYNAPLFTPRSDTTHDELGDLVKTNNPEEINIDDDDTDEEETVEGEGVVSKLHIVRGHVETTQLVGA